MPGILWSREIFWSHQEQGCGAYQAHDAWAQTDEDALHHRCVHIFIQHFADKNHQNQRGENQGKGCHGTSEYGHHAAHACIVHSGIAAIGSSVDADRSWCHLRDGNDISELLHRHPMILRYHLSLNQGYHGIATSESEDAYLKEYDEKLKKYHMLFCWLNELSIDVASHGSGNYHPDGVDTYQPYQKGGEDRNPAVDKRDMGTLGKRKRRYGYQCHHGRTDACKQGSHHLVVFKLMEKHSYC